MPKSWESPFGQGKLPQEVRREAQKLRPRDPEIQRGGCGNPNCRQCYNPDGSLTRNGEQFRGGNPLRDVYREEVRRIQNMVVAEKMEFRGEFESGPPKAYVEARKEVQEWIGDAQNVQFSDIVGNDAALGQLDDAIRAPKEHAALYEAYNMTAPKGALLYGPPGCGKTMFAKAAATTMSEIYGKKVEYLQMSGPGLQTPIVGLTERYIRSIFTFAREYKKYHGHPLLVFIDEAETILPDRTGRFRQVRPWEESQVAEFLAQMDGLGENGAFVLLATNRPEVIDEALLRDGRCDFKIEVKRPTKEAAAVILANSLKGMLSDLETDDLVFNALEVFYNPELVIGKARQIEVDFKARQLKNTHNKDFSFEHIISGAMLVSVRQRAIRYAFTRDKANGDKATGVRADDIVQAVMDIWEENKGLEHAFAREEFMNAWGKELEEEAQAEQRKGMN